MAKCLSNMMYKRIISLLLLVAVLASMSMYFPTTAHAISEGSCGEGLTWTLDNGTLTISGTGDMNDFYNISSDTFSSTAPWDSEKDSITSLIISNGVSSIGDNAFFFCTNLSNVTLPSSLTSIGSNAFRACISLQQINLPSSMLYIGEEAFAFSGLTSITLPGGITFISDAMFSDCTSLSSVTLENNITTIGANVFSYCPSLENISIPTSVTTIDSGAFDSCDSLANVYYAGTKEQWNNIEISSIGNSSLENANIIYAETTQTPQYTWKKVNGNWYCYKNDIMQTGWQKVNGTWYYMNSSGIMQTGWQKINSKWYYLNSSGAMQTGLTSISGNTYYFASGGAMQLGWIKINSTWYYFTSTGAMAKGWVKIDSKWYYFNNNGIMQTGWCKVNNKWYYLTVTGAMATSWCKVGDKWYYFDTSGTMQTGWLKSGSKWYYLTSSGAMATGWCKVGTNWYYMDNSGIMQTGTVIIDGVTYNFSSGGVWIPCKHAWVAATCTEAKHCSDCGEVEGEPLGHTSTSSTCDRCGIQLDVLDYCEVYSSEIGNSWTYGDPSNNPANVYVDNLTCNFTDNHDGTVNLTIYITGTIEYKKDPKMLIWGEGHLDALDGTSLHYSDAFIFADSLDRVGDTVTRTIKFYNILPGNYAFSLERVYVK